MVNAFIRDGDGNIRTESTPASIAAALRDRNAHFWVDINKPTDDELSMLDDVFGFHPLAIEDTINYNQRPKIESYTHTGDVCNQGYFYMVIHGPDLASFREGVRTKELDIFVSERYLITIHDENHNSIDEVLMRAKNDPGRVIDAGIDMLLHNVLDRLVDNYTPILDWMQEEIDALEDLAVTEPNQSVLQRISLKKRELLHLRRIIGPQRDMLAQLTRGEVPFIRQSTRVYLRDVYDHLVRAVELIELYRDLIVGARDIYLSSVSNNLNQIMKALTLLTVVALPINVITGFFGMNFEHLPGIKSTLALYVTLFLMLSAVGLMAFFFFRKRWI